MVYVADPYLSAPRARDDWQRLVAKVRLFQHGIGFRPTSNFRRADATLEGYPFCRHGSPLHLPYSWDVAGHAAHAGGAACAHPLPCRALGVRAARGPFNNVWLATAITYSRHFALMQHVLDTFDGDLVQALEFFRRVDVVKPEASDFAEKRAFEDETTVAFVRAYEAAIVDIIEWKLKRKAGNG